MLQIMDDGLLTDSQGRKVNFKNTIIVMTSNIGARNITDKQKTLGFSSTEWKHTARNCADVGAFTWNLVSFDLLGPMNETATYSDVDEFERAGLTPVASEVVVAPRVGEARVTFECTVTQQVELTGVDGRLSGAVLTLGEVVMVHIDDSLLVDGIFDTARAQPLLRGGGPTAYFGVGERADLARPLD